MIKYLIRTIFFCLFFLTACSQTPISSVPAMYHDDRTLLDAVISYSSAIEELYYEEVPVNSYYSGGIKIQSTTKVWLKNNILKTEQITGFYQGQQLLDREINGEVYDYRTMQMTRYYIGNNPEQIRSQSHSSRGTFIIPRQQTILWYLDRITPEHTIIFDSEVEGEQCFVVEILKNQAGSTRVWINASTKLPVKIVNSYNGSISEREYCNFKVGKGSVSDKDLGIPQGAFQY